MRQNWTDTELRTLKALYPDVQGKEIALILKRPLKQVYSKAAYLQLKKSEGFLKSMRSGRRNVLDFHAKEHQFPKGHVPYNKGKKWSEYLSEETKDKMRKTTFKKGNVPANTKSDGEITLRNDGSGLSYKHIRIKSGKWVMLHIYNWQKKYGNVPEGYIIVFKTPDRSNCEVSNLELITREENMARNSIQRFPEDLIKTIKTLSRLKKEINGKE